ncbi:hypothetical protein [Rhizobium ruizarguesonis]|uniref:hypothetical protein n=1 Tax=Rhizobium ruizarguesonis TaxID=2081791 RepID=UPI0019540439|nr:hypothetical protein [Rhizobium ruizarguesonis]
MVAQKANRIASKATVKKSASAKINWDAISPVGEAKRVDVKLLTFDVNNPRFTPDKRPEADNDVAIISKLVSTADLGELVQSIATSGYINIEPLIVVLRDNKLVVLEGNRRLGAIKCLKNPSTAASARIAIPEFSAEVGRTLNDILVYRVAKEEDARELIGFKHINGPQAWDAYAKAVFAARWLDSDRGKKTSLSLAQIAARMGDKHATIHRMVTAYYVLAQAEEEEVYLIDDRFKKSFSFSHLYTGLSYLEFTDYLGMERTVRTEDPIRQPIDRNKFNELRQLLIWLYGSKSEATAPVVQSQNPDLGKLRDVLGSKAATVELETRGDLISALVTATPKHVRFSKHLVDANAELLRAQETLDGFDPLTQSELHQIAQSVFRRATMIRAGVDAAMGEMERAEAANSRKDERPAKRPARKALKGRSK